MTLEMKHPLGDGVQRVRCFPFANHDYQHHNLRDTVLIRPTGSKNFKLPRDEAQLEYGRVILLFKILVPGVLGRTREAECAFVKYFDKYLVQGEPKKSIHVNHMSYICNILRT